eukprot:7863062-Pyramimonas_sp.AAC.1
MIAGSPSFQAEIRNSMVVLSKAFHTPTCSRSLGVMYFNPQSSLGALSGRGCGPTASGGTGL